MYIKYNLTTKNKFDLWFAIIPIYMHEAGADIMRNSHHTMWINQLNN